MLRQQIAMLVLLIFVWRWCLHTDAVQHTEDGLELLFRERTQSDWQNVWHHETHSRCRNKLRRHLFWACEKDIYRITRRNGKRNNMNNNNNNNNSYYNYYGKKKYNNSYSNINISSYNNNNNKNKMYNEAWLKSREFSLEPTWLRARAQNADELLRTRRTERTITQECCSKNGCTWEEYAEYCQTNKRRTHNTHN